MKICPVPARFLLLLVVTLLLSAFTVLTSSIAHAASGINQQITFQGKVVNKTDGTNVTDGNYNFTFSVYNVSSGGSALWTDTYNSGSSAGQVAVTSGIFRVNLGEQATPLPGSIDFDTDTLYLGVNFNGDGEMSPRVRLTAVSQAFNALKVAGLTVTSDGSTPATTGSIIIPNGATLTFPNGTATIATSTLGNLSSVAINTSLLPASNNAIDLGSGSLQFRTLYVGTSFVLGTSGANFTTLNFTTPTAANAITFPNASGTVAVSASNPLSLSAAGALSLKLTNANDTDATSSNNSGLITTTNGVGLLRGCSDGQVLKWTLSGGTWGCATTAVGTFVNFALASTQTDSSTNNSIDITKTGVSGSALSLTDISYTAASSALARLTFKNNAAASTGTVNGLLISQTPAANASGNTSDFINLTSSGAAVGTVNGLEYTGTLNRFTNLIKAGTTFVVDSSGNITAGNVNGNQLAGANIAMSSSTTSGNINTIDDGSLTSNNSNLLRLTPGNNSTGAGTTTINGIAIAPIGAANSTGTNVTNAINLENAAASTGNSFVGLNIGTGYGTLISAASFSVTSAGNVNAGTYNTTTISGSALTFGTNSTASLNAQGTNIMTINATSTGNIQFQNASSFITSGGALTVNGNLTMSGASPTISATNASTFAINGPTSQAFNIQQGGSNFISLASTGALTIASLGANQNVIVHPAGTGNISLVLAGGGQTSIAAIAPPTVDQMNITNTGQGVSTAGVNSLSLFYVGGAAAVEAGGERIDFTPGTTAGAGAIWNGLRVVGGAIATAGITANDLKLETTTLTLSGATTETTNINGLSLPTAGALIAQTAGTHTIIWNGSNLAMPTVTCGASCGTSNVTANGLAIALGAITQTTGTAAANGINITPTTFTTGGTQNMIKIGSLTAPTVGLTSGEFYGTGWSDLHSSTAANNNFSNLVITASSAGANANNFTIKNSAATMQPLLEVRDLNANTNAFGSLAIAGAFMSKQSYFGEEFSSNTADCIDNSAINAAETNNESRGTMVTGRAVGTTLCTTSGGDNNTTEISTSKVSGAANGSNTCTFSQAAAASNTNGVEIIKVGTAAATVNVACEEYIGTSADNTGNMLFNSANLPQIQMKFKPEQTPASAQRYFMGVGTKVTAAASMATTDKGAYFTNCTAPTTPTCGNAWVGAVSDGTTVPNSATSTNAVACPATDADGSSPQITNMMYGRIEFRKSPATTSVEIQFFIDYDVSNGIHETSCGTVTTIGNSGGLNSIGMTMMSMVVSAATGSALPTNLDIDYFRVWQDDSPAFPPPPSPTSSQATPVNSRSDSGDSANISRPLVPDYTTAAAITQSYPTDMPSAPLGTLVAFDPDSVSLKVKSADSNLRSHLIGVTTPDPAMKLGDDLNAGVRVAISGRAMVRVSNENGPIKVEDALTAGQAAGVVVKATKPGFIIGRALTPYSSKNEGVIPAQINIIYDGSLDQVQVTDSGDLFSRLTNSTKFVWQNSAGNAVAWITYTGDAFFQSVQATTANFRTLIFGELVATKDSGVTGHSQIDAGRSDVFVPSTKVRSNSTINLTATSNTGGLNLYIKKTDDSKGFTVGVSNSTVSNPIAPADILFNWLIISQK
jgi:hypothetical protein